MKAIIFTLSLLFIGMNFGLATPHPTKKIVQYKKVQSQTIELPTNFAKPFIIDQKDIDLLAGKTIHHVELVYTEYHESPSFNQNALNAQRVSQLKQLLPQINADNPSWTYLEQTGAKTRDVANNYFHGFVIHYGDKLDHSALGEFLSEFAGKRNQFKVFYPEGGSFKLPSGTTINIHPNAVTYMDGKAVSGYYTLYYSEYRDPAQIALSGLPMNYADANFSSVGMYELRAEKDGKELKLIQPMSVDFNCTKVVNDAAFFSMNDKTGEWKKEHDIQFANNARDVAVAAAPVQEIFIQPGMVGGKEGWNMNIQWFQIDGETSKAMLDKNAWLNYKNLEANEKPDGIIFIDSLKRTFIVESDKMEDFQKKVFTRKIEPIVWDGTIKGKRIPNDKRSTLLAEGSSDPGHTYPTIVKGLNSPNFGVYNCDQIYRIGDVARVSPVYKDKETGKEISSGHVACVMDLSYNGSFSFHPNFLTLNKEGRNAVLLFTQNKEIYLLDERTFSTLDLDDRQTVEFPMKNVTNLLKSPSDLKKLLNI